MIQGKYLASDGVIDLNDISSGYLNLINTNCGSGKTTFALTRLIENESLDKVLYLIDTCAGRDAILKAYPNITKHWDLSSSDFLGEDGINFNVEEKIIVMTYAKFGSLCKADNNFYARFDLIICDEFHSPIKYLRIDKAKITRRNPEISKGINSKNREIKSQALNKRDTILSIESCIYNALNAIKNAILGLKDLALWDTTSNKINHYNQKVVAMTATPREVYKSFQNEINEVEAHCQVFAWETLKTIEYTSILLAVNALPLNQKAIIYASKIQDLKSIEELCQNRGFKTISLWSINNKEIPLNSEQIKVRNYLLEKQSFPEGYDILLINEAYATSINILENEKLKQMIIHNGNEDIQIQTRNRYRGDLEVCYLYNRYTKEQPFIEIPIEMLDCPLDADTRKEFAKRMGIKNESGRVCGWPTLKKILIEQGYTVESKKIKGKHYDFISYKSDNKGLI